MIGQNNPLNIRTSPHFTWNGQTGSTRGFCNFESTRHGRRVGLYLLMRSYRRAGVKTIAEIIRRFAPPSENNTSGYIKTVCRLTHFKANFQPKETSDFCEILAAMEIVENGAGSSHIDELMVQLTLEYLTVSQLFNVKPYES